MSNICYVRGK